MPSACKRVESEQKRAGLSHRTGARKTGGLLEGAHSCASATPMPPPEHAYHGQMRLPLGRAGEHTLGPERSVERPTTWSGADQEQPPPRLGTHCGLSPATVPLDQAKQLLRATAQKEKEPSASPSTHTPSNSRRGLWPTGHSLVPPTEKGACLLQL